MTLNRTKAAELIGHSDTLATTLLTIALNAYGSEVFGDEEEGVEAMDPIELWNRLEEDFRVSLPVEAENRLNALMLAISTDAFYEDPAVFTAVAGALYEGGAPDMVTGWMDDLQDDLTLPEVLWSIFEVALVRADEPDFSPAVRQTIERMLGAEVEEDMGLPEQVLPHYDRFVETMKSELIEQLTYIGVDRKMLDVIRAHDPTPTHDAQGDWMG